MRHLFSVVLIRQLVDMLLPDLEMLLAVYGIWRPRPQR
jgi:hypothetical protein